MSEQDNNLMEGQILTEEGTSQSSQKEKVASQSQLSLPKVEIHSLKEKILAFKKPKPITIIFLFIILVATLAGLVMLSNRGSQEEEINPDVVIASPIATPVQSEETTKIYKNLDNYDQKVDNLNESIDNYGPPRVDLNVNF